MGIVVSALFVFVWDDAIPASNQRKRVDEATATAPKFTDVTSAVGVRFQYLASHTSKKYLIETMGAGVTLFDYDNDGRLDQFLVNGAPISDRKGFAVRYRYDGRQLSLFERQAGAFLGWARKRRSRA
jgi:hypothetical protein